MAKKKASGPKKSSQKYKAYSASGDSLNRKNKSCPKCGVGSFMAKHQNRETCGKCGYTEFISAAKNQ